jgi:hypothetical protein
MVTTRNSAHRNTANSDGEGNLLLDELILILKNNEHTAISYNDVFICVHEKAPCYNICKISAGIECENYEKALEAKLMTNTEITEGDKSFVC